MKLLIIIGLLYLSLTVIRFVLGSLVIVNDKFIPNHAKVVNTIEVCLLVFITTYAWLNLL